MIKNLNHIRKVLEPSKNERVSKNVRKPKERCKNCKWIEELPFTNTYICENNYSSYAGCDCDIENDSCEAWENKDSDKQS